MQLLYHSFHTAEIPPSLLQRIIMKTALSIIGIEYWWKILLPAAVLRKISLEATLFTSNVAITLAIVSKTTTQYVEDGPGFSIARFTYVFTGMCIFYSIRFTDKSWNISIYGKSTLTWLQIKMQWIFPLYVTWKIMTHFCMFWGFYDRYLIALILFDFQWTCNREDSSCHLSIY